MTPHVVTEEEKKLCVRAQEQELFTPFLPTFGNIGEEKNTNESINTNNGTNANSESDANQDANVENLEISCEINFEDFLSIEPEVQINLTDEAVPLANLILPVDCDYSDDQLKQILTKSFDIENDEQKEFISNDSKRVICYECRTEMTTEHLCHRMVCDKCRFATHCKTAFESHTSEGHKEPIQLSDKQITVFKPFPQLLSFKIICRECEFVSNDGNQLGI